jgi:hypothetical protein
LVLNKTASKVGSKQTSRRSQSSGSGCVLRGGLESHSCGMAIYSSGLRRPSYPRNCSHATLSCPCHAPRASRICSGRICRVGLMMQCGRHPATDCTASVHRHCAARWARGVRRQQLVVRSSLLVGLRLVRRRSWSTVVESLISARGVV